jgi:lipopolysaccharide export system protein LptA
MTIHWTRNMFFDGQNADFNGGITAYQDDSAMRAATLQVALDKKVSLKEGQKAGNEAKVDKLVAHDKAENPVWVLDVTKDEKDSAKINKMTRLTGNQVAVDNTENRVNTTGPGTFTILQYSGESGPVANAPKAKPGAPAKAPELMLTRVDFQDRLFSGPIPGSTSTRLSKFYGNILVVHLPGDNLDAKVDLGNLPKGGMMIQSEVLTVTSREMPDPKDKTKKVTKQEMCAEGRVYCRSGTDIVARAEKANFDESSSIVTFVGSRNNLASIYQLVGGPGGKWRESKGETIQYNRETGAISVDGGTSIIGWRWVESPLQDMVALGDRRVQ